MLKRNFILGVCGLLFFLWGCGSGVGEGGFSGQRVNISLQFTNPNPEASGTAKAVPVSDIAAAKAVARAGLSTCTVTATGSGMSTVNKTFDVSSGASTISASLDVSLGPSRTFVVDCSDGSETTNGITIGYSGSVTSDLDSSTTAIRLTPQFRNLIADESDVVHYVRLNQENSAQTKLTVAFGNALTDTQKNLVRVLVELDTGGSRTSLGTIDSGIANGLKGTKATPYIEISDGGPAKPVGFLRTAAGAIVTRLNCSWAVNTSGNTEAVCLFGIRKMKGQFDSDQAGQFAVIGSLTGASPWDSVPNSGYAKYDLSPNTSDGDIASLVGNGSSCDTSRNGETCESGFCATSGSCISNTAAALAGTVTTLVGPTACFAGPCPSGSTDATGNAARFNSPVGACVTPDGLTLFILDSLNRTVRKAVITTGVVTTFAGTAGAAGFDDGTGAAARFDTPNDCVVDHAGTNFYVSDSGAHTIRKIVIATQAVTTVAGTGGATGSTNGTGTAARFTAPQGLAITRDDSVLYVVDGSNHLIRKIVLATAAVSTLAGTGVQASDDGTFATATFDDPVGIAIDSTDNKLYVSQSNRMRTLSLPTEEVTTLVIGNLGGPEGLAIDPTDTYLYVASVALEIRRVTIADGTVLLLAGSGVAGDDDAAGVAASFGALTGIAIDPTGLTLYIPDGLDSEKIRKLE